MLVGTKKVGSYKNRKKLKWPAKNNNRKQRLLNFWPEIKQSAEILVNFSQFSRFRQIFLTDNVVLFGLPKSDLAIRPSDEGIAQWRRGTKFHRVRERCYLKKKTKQRRWTMEKQTFSAALVHAEGERDIFSTYYFHSHFSALLSHAVLIAVC